MRRLSRLLLAAALVLGGSGQAGAASLTLTGGSLGISIGALPPINFPCTACPLVLDVSNPGVGGGFTEPANVFVGSLMLPTSLFTGVPLINGLTIGNLANGPKTIAPGEPAGPRVACPAAEPCGRVLRAGGGLGGFGPLVGSAFVNVLGLFNLAVPLDVVGNTGAATAVVAGTLAVSVNATGWTTGNITVDRVTTGEPADNTVVNVGYDNRNPSGNGVVQLISAFHVTTNAAGNLPGLAIQTLTFAPEPGQILLVGGALGTLALLARRRPRG
jgi:hypothetical protein